jgi:hypothetical protein
MTPDLDGLPQVGPVARKLGVRVPEDVTPNQAGEVVPGTGGMSVFLGSVWNLPHHRRPRGMGQGSTGPLQDHVFSIGAAPLQQRGLVARPDPDAPQLHALVEPVQQVALQMFEASLAATRPDWQVVWP